MSEELRLDIISPEDRLIAGWASVEVVDRQNEIIPREVLERAMYKYMDRGGNIMFAHSSKPVGKVLKWEIRKHPKVGADGVFVVAKIFKDYETDDAVWEMIKRGELKGFSVGGKGERKMLALKEGSRGDLPPSVGVYEKLELMEISLAPTPANPYAEIVAYNSLAKAHEEQSLKLEDVLRKYGLSEVEYELGDGCYLCNLIRKVYSDVGDLNVAIRVGVALYNKELAKAERRRSLLKSIESMVDRLSRLADVSKPFGKWRNFQDCVNDMKSQGYGEDSAKRICGSLQAKFEKYHNFVYEAYEHIDKAVAALEAARQAGADVDEHIDVLSEVCDELAEMAEEDEYIDLGEDFTPMPEDRLRELVGDVSMGKEFRKDKRPPKRWWNRCVSVISSAKPDYTEEQVRAICGSMWHHGWGIGSPKGRREYGG
ncbi:MAG: XkdF-like putative serine protease domain-containing protein [Candidatus Caldarchaeum sp.]